jgi:hypothetical protein
MHWSTADMQFREGIFKLFRSPGIDAKESILPAYVAWRADTITLYLLGSYLLHCCALLKAQRMTREKKTFLHETIFHTVYCIEL